MTQAVKHVHLCKHSSAHAMINAQTYVRALTPWTPRELCNGMPAPLRLGVHILFLTHLLLALCQLSHQYV